MRIFSYKWNCLTIQQFFQPFPPHFPAPSRPVKSLWKYIIFTMFSRHNPLVILRRPGWKKPRFYAGFPCILLAGISRHLNQKPPLAPPHQTTMQKYSIFDHPQPLKKHRIFRCASPPSIPPYYLSLSQLPTERKNCKILLYYHSLCPFQWPLQRLF